MRNRLRFLRLKSRISRRLNWHGTFWHNVNTQKAWAWVRRRFPVKSHEFNLQTMVIATIIYQIESMVFCFVRKHQTIATTLKKYLMPRWLIWCLFSFFAFDICVVVGLFSQTCIDQDLQMEYVRVVSKWRRDADSRRVSLSASPPLVYRFFQNFPDYLPGFQSLPNFSIYEADAFFVGTVVFAVTCGIISFFILCIILANIFRMLSLLKSQISASNYRKHRAAIWSLLAQFATSSVCVVPPIFFVFVVLIGIDGAQGKRVFFAKKSILNIKFQ